MTILMTLFTGKTHKWLTTAAACLLLINNGCQRSNTVPASSEDEKLPRAEALAATAVDVVSVQSDTRFLCIQSALAPLESTDDHVAAFQVGRLYEHEESQLEFVLTNPSDAPLVIASIAISCPCATIEGPCEQILIGAQGEYLLRLRLSAALIPFGAYMRTLFVELQNGIIQQIRLHGEVFPIYDVQPSRTIDLGLLKDCSADWQREVTVKGAGAYSSSLRLSEHVESDYLQGQAIAASVAGGYVLRIRARSSLPYSSSFQTKLSWPVLEPAGLPPLLLTINAVVGDDLRFEPATISFGEEDFSPGGVARAVASCGIIPAPASGASAEVEQPHRSRILAGIAMLREERLRNNVDWQTLFSALTIEQPEGVAVKKIRYEYGVALQIEVRQEALNSSSVAQVIARRDQQILGQINLVLRTGQTPP